MGGKWPCLPPCFGTLLRFTNFRIPSLYLLCSQKSCSISVICTLGFKSNIREAILRFSLSIRSFSSFLALKCKLFDRLCSLNWTVEWLLGNRFYILLAISTILLLFQPEFQRVSSIEPSYLCRLILASLLIGLSLV